MRNYEAYDINNEISIYNGSSKLEMINELLDYIQFQNHINENLISENEIQQLDDKALKNVGIKVYVNA